MIYQIINEIKNESKTNIKKDILEKYKDNELLKRVIKLSIDQDYQSGIKKIPEYTSTGQSKTLSDALDLLEQEIYTRNVTGNAAIKLMSDMLGSLSENDRDVFIKVFTKKLDCGIQAKNANAVYGNDFISIEPYMRCDLLTLKTVTNINFKDYGYAVTEVKMDGQYLNHIIFRDTYSSYSRSGVEYDFLGLKDEDMFRLQKIAARKNPAFESGAVPQGEALVLDSTGNVLDRKTGNGIIQKAGKDTITEEECSNIIFVLWDLIPYDAYKERIYNVPRKERREFLEECLAELNSESIRMIEYKKVKSIKEAFEYNKEKMEDDEEGTIIKSEDGIWKAHTSPKQLKLKLWMDVDMRIKGFIEGTGKRKGKVGSLILESEDGLFKVNCGTGLKEKDAEWTTQTMYERFDELYDTICTIRVNDIISNKKDDIMRFNLVVFDELRPDKSDADTYERIMQIRESAVLVFTEKLNEVFNGN